MEGSRHGGFAKLQCAIFSCATDKQKSSSEWRKLVLLLDVTLLDFELPRCQV